MTYLPWPVAAMVFCAAASAANENLDLRHQFQRPEFVPFPDHAPYNIDIAALGKMLFFDQRLSGGQNQSCATCHNPSFGWEAPLNLALGSDNAPLDRHSPSLFDLAWAESFFWDGRASSLEEQAVGPLTSPREMNANLDEIVQRLESIRGYKQSFELLFPDRGISPETIIQSLATYERTIVSGISRFDRWVMGDEHALNPVEKRGFEVFAGPAGCAACHSGWRFTNGGTFDIGLVPDHSSPEDTTQLVRVKVPGLRDIQLRAPFMHDGSLPTLRSVIQHYQNGGIASERETDIHPLSLGARDVEALEAFLNSLTEENPDVSVPILPAE